LTLGLALLGAAIVAPAHAQQSAEEQVSPLVPGMVVDELPLRLPNINNLRFSPEGRLTALGYNGKVYLLADTDGDGLEDDTAMYWDQATLRVPVGMAWSERGLYVSSHGKVSLLRDTDGDGQADKEEIVSQGWPPTDVKSGGVDATAVTIDPQGNLYFGLMCADYSNPYRLREGRSQYDPLSLRGTIVRLSGDHSQREIISTGIRVPYTLAFNRHGDLFVTDQEGETWLPNGNPFDELNHIVPGRHYGFPPRHAEHLPDIRDEPPVVSFGPQHQSTCGLVFNEASPEHAAFGPAAWEGDAFVTGFSRGRLWRVRLIKTPHGYVGRPTPLVISSMLLADVAISPRGELYLACHSGAPDWGTGPQGEGRLFRLRYVDNTAPQPVLAYPASPLELKVAFDRPIDPSIVETTKGNRIEYGENVRAADRLEVLKPPYAAVEKQSQAHRGSLRIASAALSSDGDTLTLISDPHSVRGSYALTLAGVRGVGSTGTPATIDLDYDLSGVQAKWLAQASNAPGWNGWLPHVESAVATALSAGSSDHQKLFSLLDQEGELHLEGQLGLPPGSVTLRLTAASPCKMRYGQGDFVSSRIQGEVHLCEIMFDAPSIPQRLEIDALSSSTKPFHLHLTYQAPSEAIERVVQLHQLSVPWTPPALDRPVPSPAEDSPMVVGNPERGERLFFGQTAKCANCHTIHGRGAELGPDLSNSSHRTAASVLLDIREPSAAINPDYLNYSVVLKDGRTFAGTVRTVDEVSLQIVDSGAKVLRVPMDDVEVITAQASSMMPQGLLDSFSETDVQDLLAFLIAAPPAAKHDTASPTFPRRSPAEVQAVLEAFVAQDPVAKPKPLDLTLVAGKQDHGQGEHDYPAWLEQWSDLLKGAEGVTVHQARNWPSAEQWRESEVFVFYFWNHDWSADRLRELDAFLARGGGAVVLHSALISDNDPESLAKRWGLAAQPKRTKYRHGPVELHFTEGTASSLIAGVSKLSLVDETYWPMIGDRSQVTVLATAVEDAQEHPMLWTFTAGQGRVFASVLGHYHATLEDPLFQVLLLRGLAWSAREPISRFQSLLGKNQSHSKTDGT